MPKEDYKPNSHKYNEVHENHEKPSRKQSAGEKKRPSVREHKSVGQRFKDTFFNVTFKEALIDAVTEVIVPAIQDGIYDAITAIISSLFGRSDISSYSRGRSYSSKTDYRRASSRRRDDDRRSSVRTRPARSFSIERFEFESRSEAEDVLSQMNEQCRKYDGVCPVSSFYDFIDCERPADWTHERWGWSWNALDRARIIRKSNGWYALSIAEPDTYID